MTTRDLGERMRRLMDRLDERVMGELHPAGGVRAVDRYHDNAGFVERRVLPFADELGAEALADHARSLRILARVALS